MFVRSKPGERGILVITVCVFVLTTFLIFVLFGIYLFTDCRHKFRGVSDIFLALSFLALFYFGMCLIYAVVIHASVPKLDRLLSIMAEAGNRNDEDSLLLLEVGEDCLRRFWEQQLREDRSVSLSVRRTCSWLTYCLEEQPAANDLSYMSAAFFAESQVFLPHAPGDGAGMVPSLFTRTSISRATDGGWHLRFLTSARRSQQTLLQRHDIEVEVPQVFPLEAQDVQRAREWLARHEVFHFDAEIDGEDVDI
eukprot:Skav234176  [mRNA]  locus=scaffold1377:7607:9086:- [translate_table: standard]